MEENEINSEVIESNISSLADNIVNVKSLVDVTYTARNIEFEMSVRN